MVHCRMKRVLTVLGTVMGLAAPAVAQEGFGGFPTEPPVAAEAGGEAGVDFGGEGTPTTPPATDLYAPPPGPPPVDAAEAPPAGEAAPPVDTTAEVNANYDATLAIYQSILDEQQSSTGTLDRRIQANEEMVGRYRPELVKAEEGLRGENVRYVNTAYDLTHQKDSGVIGEDKWHKLVANEERKHVRRSGSIDADADFYRDEIVVAEERLKGLKTDRKILEDKLARENKGKPKKKEPGERVMDGLGTALDKLSGFETRHTMDCNIRCRLCNRFHGSGSVLEHVEAEAEASGEAEEVPEGALPAVEEG